MSHSIENINEKKFLYCILCIALVFQEPISLYIHCFSYIDELVAAIGIIAICINFKMVCKKDTCLLCLFLGIFLISGLAGNIIYKYQSVKAVLIDAFTNVKFFLAIAAGFYMLRDSDDGAYLKSGFIIGAKISSIFLIILSCIDRIFNLFGGQIRYGIRSTTLMYSHPTYLAGACVFLIGILTLYWNRSNLFYVVSDLIIVFFTFRGKAMAASVVFILLWIYIKYKKKILKIWQVLVLVAAALLASYNQIVFYFVIVTQSARRVMLLTSFKIMRDYFPIGTGFATYASHMAVVNYSPVYVKYGFLDVFELSLYTDSSHTFFDDQFWPIIFGQTGVMGTIAYIMIMFLLARTCWNMYKYDRDMYLSAIFMFAYLLIASAAEPAFNNSVSIPFAVIFGMMFRMMKRKDDKLCIQEKQG